jgi:molybdopterin molybdotransferase
LIEPFDSIVIVDWSAGNDTGSTPKKDAIWVGAVLAGVAQEPVYLRNRVVAFEYLRTVIRAEVAVDRRLMIGFDFPFAYPKGFAETLKCGTNTGVFEYFNTHLTDTPKGNNRFALAGKLNGHFAGDGPFWFNGLKADVPGLPRKKPVAPTHGQKEKRRVEEQTKGTFSCWQMGGTGAVGGQVMTGMAFLSKLRAAFPSQIAVWPFERLSAPVALVEIWPSLINPAVRAENDAIKDRAQVRLLAHAFAQLRSEQLSAMLDVETDEEGWILGAGFEEELLSAICR